MRRARVVFQSVLTPRHAGSTIRHGFPAGSPVPPRDAVLTVLTRDKEWVQVQLTPELRKTGLVMRWYKNEVRGWMHDSTVVPVK
jgi:hypothetical protein